MNGHAIILAAALAIGGAAVAWGKGEADGVPPLPQYDTPAYCKGKAPACAGIESAAKQSLPGQWKDFPPPTLAGCIKKGTDAGGSYQVIMSCLFPPPRLPAK